MIRGSLAVLLGAALLAEPAGAAGTGLPAPPVPAYEAFEAMLAYCEDGRLDRLGALVRRSEALLAEVDSSPGAAVRARLEAALEGGDRGEAEAAVLRLIYFHMMLELRRTLSDERPRPAGLRLAYLDYLFLEPRLRREAAAAAEAEFKAAHEVLRAGTGGWRQALAPRFGRLEAFCAEVLADER